MHPESPAMRYSGEPLGAGQGAARTGGIRLAWQHVTSLGAAAMSEANPGPGVSPEEQGHGPDRVEPQHQHDGRYIPYSGGSLGWYRNSGVLRRESVNNYQFGSVMDEALVRAKQHLRSGLGGEKRRSARKVLGSETTIQVTLGAVATPMQIINVSKHGAKLVYVGEELVPKNGAKLTCAFPAGKGGAPAFELQCTIVHTEQTGKKRVVWLMGIDFPIMTPEQASALASLLGLEA
jgi:hypothetical protein